MIKYSSSINVHLIDSMGGDHMVIAAAKVSTTAEECLKFTDPETADVNYKLINYLMTHRHGTPFEHGSMIFFIKAPIFVWREWHRHRIGFSYNEESARYKQLEPEFYLPLRNRAMMKVENWKPGRPKFTPCTDDETYDKLIRNLKRTYEIGYENYQRNLDLGIDPGLARDCLPVGIYSSCWVTCNPRSLMAFLSLRTSDAGASYPLYEIEVAAKKCEKFFEERWPLTYKAFMNNGRVAP